MVLNLAPQRIASVALLPSLAPLVERNVKLRAARRHESQQRKGYPRLARFSQPALRALSSAFMSSKTDKRKPRDRARL
jgi:hypothetical protein